MRMCTLERLISPLVPAGIIGVKKKKGQRELVTSGARSRRDCRMIVVPQPENLDGEKERQAR